MKTLLRTLFLLMLLPQICFAQINNDQPIRLPHTSHTPGLLPISLHPSFYDRKVDWQWIIDSTWGPGESLSEKLETFDLYQEYARAYNCTFLWNRINWDSLATSLRSKITISTSRGGFANILKELSLGMIDGHAYAYDNIVRNTPLNPGIPILADGGGVINHFGAGLTPLADSSLLVYKVVPNHPLGLVPGDIVLGYQGVPWSQLVRELMAGGVPNTLWVGAAPSAYKRSLLWAAGESWHLFDTIDVKKYSTGLVEHLPLDPMVNLVAPGDFINNEQLPIPGVPMPIYNPNCCAVTYGIVDGTNIGYIYVWKQDYSDVGSEFDAAVLALMETEGLIIDIRTNWGGSYGLNDGISRLLNHSTFTMDGRKRCSPNDLYTLCSYTPSWLTGAGYIPNDIATFYDRPIAVLLGPNCLSYGDISSWQLSYVPNARMFGRSPMALYSGTSSGVSLQPTRPGYSLRCPNVTFVDHYEPEIPRWGQEYPDFEEVWLTPDGVANGEDDVVKRALEWMNNLVYPHNIITDKNYYTPGIDSVHIYTSIENPNSNQISATAYLKTSAGVIIDSVNLSPILLNSSGEQWSGKIGIPSTEDFYFISVTAFDHTNSEQFSVPNATRFTTVGPIELDNISWTKSSTNYYITPFLENQSTVTTITNVSVKLICNDPWITSINPTYHSLPNISPGGIVGSEYPFVVNVDNSSFPGYFNFKVEVMSDGWPYWTDSMRVETAFQLDVSVVNGWNMVSIPGLHPVNQNVLTWWAGKDPLADVFKYGGLGYNAITDATPGEGYWMKHLGANVYNTGDEWPSSGIQFVLHNPLTGIAGWNLIGGYEQSVSTSGLTTNPPGLITGPVYKYSGGYQVATTLDPGYGYWIKLTASGQIIIPEGLAKGEVDYFAEHWGRIILTDAAGRSYTLYTANNEVDLNLYELPPAPPAGMFDIRYSSGRIAEDLSDIQTIEMSGVVYPLKVKVENMDIRLQDETGKILNVSLKDGENVVIDNSTITKLMVSGELIPSVYSLSQNYPNPFNPSTKIEYSIRDKQFVTLVIYDILGSKVVTLVNEEKTAGKYEVEFDASALSSGVYFYQLKAGSFVETKKMILIR